VKFRKIQISSSIEDQSGLIAVSLCRNADGVPGFWHLKCGGTSRFLRVGY